MNNVLIIGIDKSNHNYKKIYGFINSFKKKYNVFHLSEDNLHKINSCIKNNLIDTIFCETENFLNINFTNVKNCILWSNYDISKILKISNIYQNTKFIFACKSVIHRPEITKNYIKNYGINYQIHGQEGQNLENLLNILSKSKKIDKDTFAITNNLYYMYLPCCLSEVGKIEQIEYDICYFGTVHNRPSVKNILLSLKSSGYRVISSLFSGIIPPEECIEYYSKTICTVSEQVHPVGLEFPVRLGESTANGCRLFLFDNFNLSHKISEKIPEYSKVENQQSVVDYINLIKKDDSLRKKIHKNFSSTYDKMVENIEKILENY